jgi:hypothetical protein
MDPVLSMNIIRRADVFIAAAVVVAFVALAASGCGSATTAVGGTTSGPEHKTTTQVLHDAAAAVRTAGSYHMVATGPVGSVRERLDLHIQGSSFSGALTTPAGQAQVIKIGNVSYLKANQAVLKLLGAGRAFQRLAGRWIKIPGRSMTIEGFSPSQLATVMLRDYSHLEPTVTLATLGGAKVVVISSQDGSKMYVADTGPAYPFRLDFIGPNPQRWDFTEYGARFHITAPGNAVDLTGAGN